MSGYVLCLVCDACIRPNDTLRCEDHKPKANR